MRTLAFLLFFMTGLLVGQPTDAAQEVRRDCDSCRFQVKTLDVPFSLIGTWLFTRDDQAQNKDIDLDTRTWTVIKAPGPWKNAYADGKVFSIGWYRAVFEFSPDLVGQEVVLLVSPYMARATVYLDGVDIYQRPNAASDERYYSIQPIPIRFKVSNSRHVFALRLDTQLMTGIYHLPFELRKFQPQDPGLIWEQFHGAELRLLAATLTFTFGAFFLLVYWKTRHGLYVYAALTSLAITPFFVVPTDYMLRFFPPEPLFYLHYPGLIFGYFIFRFSQYFHRFTPRINTVTGVLFGITSVTIAVMAVAPNLELFQKVRVVHLSLLLFLALGAGYMFAFGVLNKQPGSRIMFGGMLVFLATGINDFLLAVGQINSVVTMVGGIFVFVSAMLFVTCVIFSNTFRENKRLVGTLGTLNKHLEDLNTHLEEMVADRTRDLDVANKDLSTSFEQLRMAKDELVRSEKLAALGALVAGIAHELNTPIGNGLMAISTLRDELLSFRKDMASKGLQRKTFDNFLITIDTASDITNRSLSRSAELVRSFKQLSIDQATDARRRFSVKEQVAGVLLMLKPTLNRTPYQIETFIAPDMTMDSYPGALVQVVTNLVNNALVHGFDGRDHGHIRIQIEPAGPGYMVMRFADDGKGIAEDVLPRIFDPFFTTKMGQGGSGLGLHITYNAVTITLGGTLHVESRPGNGTEFTMTLPLCAPSAVKPAALAPSG